MESQMEFWQVDIHWCLQDGGFTVLVTTVEYWQDKRSEDVQVMCSGGNVGDGVCTKQYSCRASSHSGR